MSPNVNVENIMQPTTLQEALNIIKFLTSSHHLEISKLKESNQKQSIIIKKLETNRKKELEYLSSELQKYEIDLALRTESVAKQLAEKDKRIQEQAEVIEELNNKLSEMTQIQRKSSEVFSVPEIMIHAFVDSNSDSGIAMENEDNKNENETTKPEAKIRKCRRFADSISFLRRVDFSPMKYKPSNRDGTKSKKDDSRKNSLDVPNTDIKRTDRRLSNDHPLSDDERPKSAEPVLSDSGIEPFVIKPKKMNDSMNNHFSDEGSDDSEEVFDRVMTRSSVRKSVKANPKYKKINRTKSKLLDHVKVNIIDRKTS